MKTTKIIDAHTFIGKWSGIDVSSSLQSLCSSMEAAGVSKAITLATNNDENEANRKLVEKHPDKLFFGFWFLPDEAHLDYLKKYRSQIHMVKFHPSHAKTRLDDPKIAQLLTYCQREDLPILVHCGRWKEMAGYEIALSVAEKYKTKILLAHMGVVFPELVKQTTDAIKTRGIKNAYLVTSGMSSSRDSAMLEQCPPELVAYAVQNVGADKILMGSDFPFGKQEEMIKSVFISGASPKDLEKILWRNATEILHLS